MPPENKTGASASEISRIYSKLDSIDAKLDKIVPEVAVMKTEIRQLQEERKNQWNWASIIIAGLAAFGGLSQAYVMIAQALGHR